MPPKNSVWNKVKQTAAQTQQTQTPPPPPPQPPQQPPSPWWSRYAPQGGETPGWVTYIAQQFGDSPELPHYPDLIKAAKAYIEQTPPAVNRKLAGENASQDWYNLYAKQALGELEEAYRQWAYYENEGDAWPHWKYSTREPVGKLLTLAVHPTELKQAINNYDFTAYDSLMNQAVFNLMNRLYPQNQQAAPTGSNITSPQMPPPNPYNYPTR